MIIVIKGNKRLCYDKMWREHAPFGSESCCVRIYKRQSRAVQIARSQNAILKYRNADTKELCGVAVIPEGYSVNAAGQVSDANDNPAGTLANFTVSLD